MVMEMIELPAELDAAIQSTAERTGRAKHDLIVEILKSGVATFAQAHKHDVADKSSAVWQIEDLESFGISEDAELSGADAKDWLRANWRPS